MNKLDNNALMDKISFISIYELEDLRSYGTYVAIYGVMGGFFVGQLMTNSDKLGTQWLKWIILSVGCFITGGIFFIREKILLKRVKKRFG